MELNIFMRELESALVERGIPGETAKKHVSNLRRTFTSDDLSEIEAIQSGSEIEQLADSISLILSKSVRNAAAQADNIPSPQPQKTAAAAPRTAKPAEAPKPVPAAKPVPKAQPAKPVPQVHQVHQMQQVQQVQQVQQAPAPKPKRQQIEIPDDEDDYYSYEPAKDVTTRGMLIFWIGLFLTLPLTIVLGAALFGTFAAVIVALSAMILGLIAVLIAVAACGAGVSLVGIVFGITQLFSFLSAGIYEIGLGIMVAGAVLFVSILLYNIAIRFLPWLIGRLGNLLGWICGKIKTLFYVVRRECYKL